MGQVKWPQAPTVSTRSRAGGASRPMPIAATDDPYEFWEDELPVAMVKAMRHQAVVHDGAGSRIRNAYQPRPHSPP
jgi:hypothetical protein